MPKKSLEHQFRLAMMQEQAWAKQKEGQIHYSQSATRDNWLRGNGRMHMNLPVAIDCSSFYTYLVWRAMWEVFDKEIPEFDPSGYKWNAVGNSSSIAAHKKKMHQVISLHEAHRGDGVVWPGKHVATLIERPSKDPAGPDKFLGTDALVVSHGNEGGPLNISLKAEVAYEGAMPLVVNSWVQP